MDSVDVTALEADVDGLVARAAAGEVIIITEHGRPTAQLTPLPSGAWHRLIASQRVRPARADICDLPPPAPGPALSDALAMMREAERY